MLSASNAHLKAANVGVKIYQRGNCLSLRATLPPRPGSLKSNPYQQYISLEVYANPAGVKRAEAEAHRVGNLLAIGKFDWAEFLTASEPTLVSVGRWVEQLEQKYFFLIRLCSGCMG
jgi:hypothetical protein